MICPLCNQNFTQITKQHLSRKHNITTQEFKTQFPEVSLSNPSSLFVKGLTAKTIEQMQTYDNDPFICVCCGKLLTYKQYTNLTHFDRHRVFCSKNCAAKVHNLGRTHSIDTKNKISKAHRIIARNTQTDPTKSQLFKFKKAKSTKIYYNTCTICKSTFIHYSPTIKHCSKICVSKTLSKNAVSTGLGGNYNRNSCWYTSPYAGKIHLESSWELLLATEFDKYNIQWCRPSYVPWVDSQSIAHKYYPDFYSFTHNVYVEPKNEYLLQKDMYKLDYVVKKYQITILVITHPSLLTTDTVALYSKNRGLIIV